MRSLSIQEFEQDTLACIAEAEAGNRIVLMRGNLPVAEIGPARVAETQGTARTEEEHRAAAAKFKTMLDKGMDLGGFRIEDRDALYERD